MSPRPRLALLTLLAATGLALVAPRVEAQSGATTGVIRGTVRDATGAVLPGSLVSLTHRETGTRVTVVTSSVGAFARSLLPPGTWDLTVTGPGSGFGARRIEGAALRVGEALDLDIELELRATESVTVFGKTAPLIESGEVVSAQRIESEVVDALPSNGRNFLNLTLLTPGVSISQGPDGDELNISGQRGIFNNFIVDGADFNNPFFGEQRGGQRPAFTFNQNAIEDLIVVNQGATAEFGRSAGGFVNVITRSGTNRPAGSGHAFFQADALAAPYPEHRGGGKPAFHRLQTGSTLGGPLARDRVFFFAAYDGQAAGETKQNPRRVAGPDQLQRLEEFLDARWPGLFQDEFGPITRSDDARSLLVKLDANLGAGHQASAKYSFTSAEQVNGTFDVDSWGASSNGLEQNRSHAVNLSLRSQFSGSVFNELRLQWAREHRPRQYDGPLLPGAALPGPPQFEELGGRPFPDIGMDFADGFRIGLPFFLPIHPAYDGRLQVVENLTVAEGPHLFKAGFELNRTLANNRFIGLVNGRYIFDSVDGFIGFVTHGSGFVTCSDGSASPSGVCPAGAAVTGPVLTFLQGATVPGVPAADFGNVPEPRTTELGVFFQDTWRVSRRVTVDAGVRWEGAWHPDVFIEPGDTFFAPYLDDPRFPSDGRIPDDLDNFQPRFGLAWDASGDAGTVVRLNVGSYAARIPMLVFGQHRTTNGAYHQTIFRSSTAPELGPVPPIDALLDGAATAPFLPDIQVADRGLELPRTWSASAELDRELGDGAAASVGYQFARTDGLFRFVNRNDPSLGAPFGIGTHPTGGGINTLTVAESTARSRYHALTLRVRGERDAAGRPVRFDANYTLAFDRSDDDNERDPFTLRYASAAHPGPEYGWSDRDRRHQLTGYLLVTLPGEVRVSSVVRFLSASPTSESCASPGSRAAQPSDRICADGSILKRNTLRKDNGFFTWDLRAGVEVRWGRRWVLEPTFEVFNVTNADNFLDNAVGALLFNFDGTLRSGLGDTRRAQLGVTVRF